MGNRSGLGELEQLILLGWVPAEPGESSRGHSRRLFSSTGDSPNAVRAQRETLLALWGVVGGVLDGGSP